MADRILEKLYRYKTEEFLDKDVPFNQLEDRINELRVERESGPPHEWKLISHNVVSRPEKKGQA